MNIGIMGGTFNPIHNGHLMLAQVARDQQRLDVVCFMPSGLPAHKSNRELVCAKHRLQMVRLAIRGQTGFEASDFEIRRGGYTYTADTLTELAARYPSDTLCFIIGGDSLMQFDTWRRPEVIADKAVLLAAGRAGVEEQELHRKAEELRRRFGAKIAVLSMPQYPVSSSELRKAFRTGALSLPKRCLPAPVFDYILQNELYREEQDKGD